jgi:hypothetical protein
MLRICLVIGISILFLTGCEKFVVHDEWVKLKYYHINSTEVTLSLEKYELGSLISSGPIKPGDTLTVEMLVEGKMPKSSDWNLLPTWTYSYLDSLIIKYDDTLCYHINKSDFDNHLFLIDNYSIVKEDKTTLALTVNLSDSLFVDNLELCK